MHRKTLATFIKQAKKIHGDKYDYSKVNYVSANTHIFIVCPIHGEFEQVPNSHIRGRGCPKCGEIKALGNTIDIDVEPVRVEPSDKETSP